MKTRKGTCDGCGRVRKLTKPEDRNRELFYNEEGRKIHLSEDERRRRLDLLVHYYWLCSECFPQVKSQADIRRLRSTRVKRPRSKLAYPIIGGPLDGEHAITDDMSTYGDALYKDAAHEYFEFNGAGRGRKRVGGFPPTMIYVHKSLLKPLISARER
jgi:hypothetical protein